MTHRPPYEPASGWLRATVPGRDLPAPEARARRWGILATALFALSATAVYLVWRAGWTLALDVWWVSIPLLVFEIHAALGLALFTFSLWDVDRRPTVPDLTETRQRIAVLIPTYNEGIEVLIPTIAAAIAMRLPHQTWVLDDGNRDDVRALADTMGAGYLARTEHDHAKAGNLNHALGIIDVDLIAVLDADHVASPDFLVRTLGYFEDPRIAVVQTPQEFYNVDSFEHAESRPESWGAQADGRFHEQTLFYRVLQPGKNRWGAAFWCGTGAVVRVTALREIGLVATDTITEDIHTTIRLHRRGWRTIYHNEVLARGLAAPDAETYQLQRLRWGTGAMQVLRLENPLFVKGLRPVQRLAYGATLLGWFDAWRSLAYLLLPIVVLFTGVVPIRADPLTFAIAFMSTFILGQVALRVLSRGCHRPVLSILFDLVRMTPNLLATTTLFTHRRATFKVTPKGRTNADRRPVRVPIPLRAALGFSVLAAAWYGLTLLGATFVHYGLPLAMHATFGWLLVNVALIWLAIRRVRAPRFAGDRRSSVRFAVDVPGHLDGVEARVSDLSLTGARVELPGGAVVAAASRLVVDLGAAGSVELDATVRSLVADSDGVLVAGVEFRPEQYLRRAHLALSLFNERARRGTPAATEATGQPALDVGAAATAVV